MGFLIRLLLFGFVVYCVWSVASRMLAQYLAKGGKMPTAGKDPRIQDVVECPVCHTYFPASSGPCARADCPRHG